MSPPDSESVPANVQAEIVAASRILVPSLDGSGRSGYALHFSTPAPIAGGEIGSPQFSTPHGVYELNAAQFETVREPIPSR